MVSAHSAGAYTATLLVMVNVMKGGGRAPPPSPAWAILPSWWNVRQKAAVATLCTLCCTVRAHLCWKITSCVLIWHRRVYPAAAERWTELWREVEQALHRRHTHGHSCVRRHPCWPPYHCLPQGNDQNQWVINGSKKLSLLLVSWCTHGIIL